MTINRVVISSGHGLYVRGASAILDEVDEARRVVNRVAELFAESGIGIDVFHDDVSRTQDENLERIVAYHNSRAAHDLDVSVHFNSFESTTKPMGCEVWYVSQASLASSVSAAIAAAGNLPDRGGKHTTSLYFLNHTNAPALLLETCFVDSSYDAVEYTKHFDAIAAGIAGAIAGISPPGPQPPEPPEPPEPAEKPVLREGDEGPYVGELQRDLNAQLPASLTVDQDFGPATENAVIEYQRTRGLSIDGIVGEQTWTALEEARPPIPLPPALLTEDQQDDICEIAAASAIARYAWADRGKAPAGCTEGIALAFAVTWLQLRQGVSWAVEMAKANTHDADKDVLAWYAGFYDELGMDNSVAGPQTLRHLFCLILGLSVRESSGRHCEGRDMSADNVSSDTAEAGLFQQSWNSHSATEEMEKLMSAYERDTANCFLSVFKQGVSCSSSEWACYGSGDGYAFQEMCKACPTYAVQSAGVGLRNIRSHWGPVNRYEVEVKQAANDLFIEIEEYLELLPAVVA